MMGPTANDLIRAQANRLQERTFINLVRKIALGKDLELGQKAVAGSTADEDYGWGSELAGLPGVISFRESVERRSLVNRIPFHRAPFATRTAVQTARPIGYRITTPGSAKPVSPMAFEAVTLDPAVVGCIIVMSEELLRSTAPGTDAAIERQLVSAVVTASNSAFLEDITDGIVAFPASGLDDASLFGDVIALLGIGDHVELIAALPWAVRLTALLGAASDLVRIHIAPEAGDTVVAVDPSGILVALGDISIVPGPSATLEMRADPTGSSTDPTASTLVSMFQTNSVALRAEQVANWRLVRPEAVAVLDVSEGS